MKNDATVNSKKGTPPDQPETPLPIHKTEAEADAEADAPPRSLIKRILKKFGIAGFIFFFLKGLILWILIPLGLFKWFGGCG